MHYKNGREAKVGDRILSVDSGGWASVGIVTQLYPGSDTCNLQIVPLRNQVCVTAKESLHVDDAFSLTLATLPPEPVTRPAVPIPGESPAPVENRIDAANILPSDYGLVAKNLPPTIVQTVCPDCGSNDGTHTKGCAQYR